jgi:myo-inositol-1(or 4)-monophosphatase
VALSAAERAAHFVRTAPRPGPAAWDRKARSDFVTEVDRTAERLIAEAVLAGVPGSRLMGEESAGAAEVRAGVAAGITWVVDPLDGTTNYLQGFPIFAVSVGLEKTVPGRRWGDMIAGAVIHPLTEEMWTAGRGLGAWKNGDPIHVGHKDDLMHTLLGTGFPYRARDLFRIYMHSLEAFSLRCAGIRRPGAAALDLCWTADGTFDGFWEHNLSPWDIAAGSLIITEAGGVFTDFQGEQNFFDSGNVVGSNLPLHPQMLEIIQAAFGKTTA